MTLPLGVALAKAQIVLLVGSHVADSHRRNGERLRTPFIAIVTGAIAFFWLRPSDIRPLLPLTIPLVIVISS